MNSSTSTNDKVETIKTASKNVLRILYYTYNTYMQYNITPKVLDKRPDLCNKHTKFSSIFDLLDSLNLRLITGHKAIEETNGFSESIISREEKKKIPFFHLGPKNNWQKNFDKEFVEKLNNIFKKNLIELGYK